MHKCTSLTCSRSQNQLRLRKNGKRGESHSGLPNVVAAAGRNITIWGVIKLGGGQHTQLSGTARTPIDRFGRSKRGRNMVGQGWRAPIAEGRPHSRPGGKTKQFWGGFTHWGKGGLCWGDQMEVRRGEWGRAGEINGTQKAAAAVLRCRVQQASHGTADIMRRRSAGMYGHWGGRPCCVKAVAWQAACQPPGGAAQPKKPRQRAAGRYKDKSGGSGATRVRNKAPHLAAPTCGRPLAAAEGGGTPRWRSYEPCRPPSSRLQCTILTCRHSVLCNRRLRRGAEV